LHFIFSILDNNSPTGDSRGRHPGRIRLGRLGRSRDRLGTQVQQARLYTEKYGTCTVVYERIRTPYSSTWVVFKVMKYNKNIFIYTN